MAVLTVSISLPDCGPHQDRAINLIMEEFYKLIEYGTGCIQGDALISINRAGKGWTLPLAQLVRMQNGERAIGPHGTILGPKWDLTIPTRIQREKDGVVQLATLSGAWCSGPKETFTVRTNTGREIRATAEHPFLTERGWLRLEDLEIGDLLHVRGKQASTGRGSKPRYIYEYRVQAHPYSVRHRRKDRPTDSYTVDQHRLVAEARENGIPYPKYLERIREGNVAGLKFLDPQKWEIHHRDRNSKNNSPDNLLVCYADGHPRTHAYEGTYKNVLFKINTETVILIEPYGEEITYDLEVDGEPHNFLANGIVVHNTGKTRIFVEAIEALVAAGEIPVLVMVPNSLIEQTVEEFEKWTSQSWVAHHVMALDGALTLENRAQLRLPLQELLKTDRYSTDGRAYSQISICFYR